MKLSVNCVNCFAGLASASRIQIICRLQEKGKMSVLEITKYLSLTQPTISHHLKYLEQAGIVKSERQGRKIYYSLNQRCQKERCNLFLVRPDET